MIQNPSETYWENYYKSGAAPAEPSNFAKYVLDEYAQAGQSLLELGCGNGRDAHYFATNGVVVAAVDQCVEEIETLSAAHDHIENLRYLAGDFTALPDADERYDLIYSRFTLHSVDAKGQQRTLEWCARNLANLGKLCIETRGQKNELYSLGEPVSGEDNAFIFEDHYRRFVDFDEFTSDVTDAGFQIITATEDTGFAPYGDTDYHFIRIIAQLT